MFLERLQCWYRVNSVYQEVGSIRVDLRGKRLSLSLSLSLLLCVFQSVFSYESDDYRAA